MGIRMLATKDMTYATRRLKAGDEIENVSGPNARLLTALGRAKLVPDKTAPAPSATPPNEVQPKKQPRARSQRKRNQEAN